MVKNVNSYNIYGFLYRDSIYHNTCIAAIAAESPEKAKNILEKKVGNRDPEFMEEFFTTKFKTSKKGLIVAYSKLTRSFLI